ncbi:hypothetical protein predicted by Glimmer/Critica [Acetobacter ghanensis]|uniref:Uncharacterized protein n=1 Tax=Acetobacter ghanensis TaxID=431306 RepID=A0A0U5F3X1_9PROT|nr:hypothetical protein predicted by Glimmer/Critica [Acetobacter ghanensis]
MCSHLALFGGSSISSTVFVDKSVEDRVRMGCKPQIFSPSNGLHIF